MSAASGGWVLERRRASADALHGSWPPERLQHRRVVACCTVVGPPALVLGSTQRDDLVDSAALAAAGVVLVHRRSGGGAVLVAAGSQVWIDAWIPRQDALWDDDVVRGALWLGDVWAAALGALGAPDASVHRGRLVVSPWSQLVCFSGTGPGEVSVAGRKVVGLAQRRSSAGARVHSTALLAWDPIPLAGLLALGADERARMVAGTQAAATGLRALLPAPSDDAALVRVVEEAVLERLPDGE